MTGDGGWASTFAWSFPASTASIAQARNAVAECVDGPFSAMVDDIRLMVSELVTNAILHASGGCEVTLRISDARLRVEVADRCPTRPQVRPPNLVDAHGRGLFLVEAMADGWGVDSHDVGKTVWFQVDARRAG
jgi:anti-sigma regulatory factor (Ser/Thr protein kinase)